jgi:hypothetical protein
MAKILLDSAGLQHYDAKIKGYMEGRLQAVLDALAGALRLRGVLKPEPDDAGVIEVVMDTVSQNPSVGDTYFFKLAATSDGKEQNAVVYYHDESGAELFDEVQNGDAIICTAERDITVTPNIPASWAILNSNWAFTAGEDGQTIEFTRDKINAIDLGTLNGVPLKFNIPTAQSAAYQLEESLIELNFVHISDVKSEENSGGTITTSINTESPTDTLIPTEKAVSEYVKKHSGEGAVTDVNVAERGDGETAIAIEVTRNNETYWTTIPAATEHLPGVMTGEDKSRLNILRNNKKLLTTDGQKTFADLKEALDLWISEIGSVVGAWCTYTGGFIKKDWDENNIIPDGGTITITITSVANLATTQYIQLRISSYDNTVYYVNRHNGEWKSAKRVVFGTDTLSTYDTDKGVKVELSGTFDNPKIDVTTTFGDVKISNSSNAVSGETIAKSVPLLSGADGTMIVQNSDLNSATYCEFGNYCAPEDSIAASIVNSPTKAAFSMSVHGPASTTPITKAYSYLVRKIFDRSGQEWYQTVYTYNNPSAPIYSSWRKILREDTTFTNVTSSSVGTGGAVPAPRTLADNDKFLRGNGTWSEIPTSSVGSGITLPATGNAVHEALTGTTYINTIGTDFIDNLFTAKG